MNSFARIILSILLLIVGFFVGTAWNNKAETIENPEDSIQQVVSLETENTADQPKMEILRTDLTPTEKSTIQLFEQAAPSVVFITTSRVRLDYFSRNAVEVPQGTGSGFIWDKIGHIATNYHVIQGADRAQVTLADGSEWEASLVGGAPEKDLAILRINAPEDQLVPLPLGDSENLLVGQSVLAIGNPFGLDHTLTTGIISALDREIESVAGVPIRGAIQTDAAINPGNSGGPLLDSSGKLIGVNTAIFSPSGAYAGIGFSIPVDVVKWVVPDLLEFGKIQRPTLGIELASQQITQRLGLRGALVMNVIEGSGAEKAGIQPTYRDRRGRISLGDIIVGIDGKNLSSFRELLLILEDYQPGDVVKVAVIRNDKEIEVEVLLGAAN